MFPTLSKKDPGGKKEVLKKCYKPINIKPVSLPEKK